MTYLRSIIWNRYFFAGIIVSIAFYNGFLKEHYALAAFSDPLLSLLVGTDPTNGDCLLTDGTNSTWSPCSGGGGGGGGVGWATTTGNFVLYNTEGQAIVLSKSDKSATTTHDFLNVYGSIAADYYTASSSAATSTLPWLSTTNLNVGGKLYAAGDPGTSGYILRTTGSGIVWVPTTALTIATATALAANGTNCSAGQFPLGVDASGAVETCTDAWTEAENTAAAYISGITAESIFDLSDVAGSSAASGTILVSDGTNFNARATTTLGIVASGGAGSTSNWFMSGGFLSPTTSVPMAIKNSVGSTTFSAGIDDTTGSILTVGSSTPTGAKTYWGVKADGRQIVSFGTNQAQGTSTLSSGAVTVNNTLVEANSIIQMTLQNCSNCGAVSVGTIVAGTSFVINSTNILDGSIVYWEIKKPSY